MLGDETGLGVSLLVVMVKVVKVVVGRLSAGIAVKVGILLSGKPMVIVLDSTETVVAMILSRGTTVKVGISLRGIGVVIVVVGLSVVVRKSVV